MALEAASGSLSDDSTGASFGEVIRDYELEPGTRWRSAVPDYMLSNKAYFQHRTKIPEKGSLEATVTKLIKNWEVEVNHVPDSHRWKTMDASKFRAAVSGGCPFMSQQLIEVGHVNMLLGNTPEYSAALNTLESSSTIFHQVFNDGFAWEVLEVLSGPPNLTFKWRHFGEFSGKFIDRNGRTHKGNGKLINIVGLAIVKVTGDMIIETVDVYCNREDFLKPLMTPNLEDEVLIGRDEVDKPARPDVLRCAGKTLNGSVEPCAVM